MRLVEQVKVPEGSSGKDLEEAAAGIPENTQTLEPRISDEDDNILQEEQVDVEAQGNSICSDVDLAGSADEIDELTEDDILVEKKVEGSENSGDEDTAGNDEETGGISDDEIIQDEQAEAEGPENFNSSEENLEDTAGIPEDVLNSVLVSDGVERDGSSDTSKIRAESRPNDELHLNE
jgi:hypothetical protein